MKPCTKCAHALTETDTECPKCGEPVAVHNPFASNNTATNTVHTTPVTGANNDAQLPPAWQHVFSYIDKAGGADLPGIKSLTNKEQRKVNINFYAFLFGFIYLLIKGMWRPAISRTLAVVAATIILDISLLIIFGKPAPNAAFIGLGMITAYRINVTYYRMQRLNERPWW